MSGTGCLWRNALAWLKTDTSHHFFWYPLILAVLLANLFFGHFPLEHQTDGDWATWAGAIMKDYCR